MSRQKACSRCKRTLPIDQFSAFNRSKDQLQSWCKNCSKEYAQHYYQARKTLKLKLAALQK